MEGNVLAELEADALALVELFPALGETRHQLHVGAAIGQAVEDVGGDGSPGHQEGVDRVPAAWILRAGKRQLAGGERRTGERRSRHGERDGRR